MGRVLGDRYRVDAPIASGGMGEVFRAVDLTTARPVAVKVLHPHLAADPEFVARMRREATVAAGLDHRNVVRVIGQGEDAGRPFLVMELVEGETLASLLEREGP